LAADDKITVILTHVIVNPVSNFSYQNQRLNIMKNTHFSTLVSFLFVTLALLFITSCGDSSTSAEEEDAPVIPEAIPVAVDVDYFTNNQPAFGEETSAFYEAAAYAQSAAATLSAGSLLGSGFLGLGQQNNAELNNGIWEWEYTFSQGSESITIRLTAEELGNSYEWNVYLSGNAFEPGQTLDNFLFLTGVVESDGGTGSWEYYYPGFQSVFLDYEWEKTSETSSTADFTFTDPDTGDQSIITYERNDDEFSIIATGDNFDSDASLFWNASTLTGSITLDGVQRCWDSSFQETACS
jgi:hypothetical protein